MHASWIVRAWVPTPDNLGLRSQECGPNTKAQWKAALSVAMGSQESSALVSHRKANSETVPAGIFGTGSRGSRPRASSTKSGAKEIPKQTSRIGRAHV